MLNLTVEKLTNVKLPCKAHKTDAGIWCNWSAIWKENM